VLLFIFTFTLVAIENPVVLSCTALSYESSVCVTIPALLHPTTYDLKLRSIEALQLGCKLQYDALIIVP